MKKTILTLTALISLSIAVSAQSKHLAKVNTIKLTDQQVIAISAKIDTLQQLILQTNQPSVFIQQLNSRVNAAFQPLWNQVQKQMVADSVKVLPKKTK